MSENRTMDHKLQEAGKGGIELTDEELDKVAGGINPFNPEGICSACRTELGDTYHVVTEHGARFYLCDGCYEKHQTGELRIFKSLSQG